LFSSQFFARTMIAAAIVTLLSVGTLNVAKAATPQLVRVQGAPIGNVQRLDEAATPPASAKLHLTFALNSSAETGIESFVDSLSDKSSPNYHKWLTPKQFGDKFGASTDDISAVTKYLNSVGCSNVKVWSNKLFVTGDITKAGAESAFGIKLHGYDREPALIAKGYTPTYFAPDKSPAIDSTVAGQLVGVFGLSNVMQRIPKLQHVGLTPDYLNGNPLDPSDLSTAYNTAALHTAGLNGQGMTIAIFSPTAYAPSDVTTFFNDEGIPQPNINIINVNGGTTDPTDEGEAVLDIETIGGQAWGATINVYEGPNDGSLDIFQQVADDNTAEILSESYGSDESDLVAAYGSVAAVGPYATSYELLRAQMAAQGISIFVATGDYSAYAGSGFLTTTPTFTYTVSIDASSAYVTGVGGTELSLTSTSAWSNEVGWTFGDETNTIFGNPYAGSNGGLSVLYKRPSWQVGSSVIKTGISNGMRQVPDVAAMAASPYFNIYDNGAFVPVAGCSGACPLWAASTLLMEEQIDRRLGNIDPALYDIGNNNPSSYHDITVGHNGQTASENYVCTPGWDFVTGWGSADFGKMVNALTAATIITPVHQFAAGLQMISVPYSYTGTPDNTSGVLSGLVDSSGASNFSIAAWAPLIESYVTTPNAPADVPVPGQGYWARFNATNGALNVAGAPVGSLIYGVGLSPGWNMIGDPWSAPIPLASLTLQTGSGTITYAAALAAGKVGSIFAYNGSGYVALGPSDSVQPWTGYWLYSSIGAELTYFL
jgi:kumamolisin